MKASMKGCLVATIAGVAGALFEYVMRDPYGIVVGMTLAIVASFSALIINECSY